MKKSSERILTTHAGSLPRPEELILAMGGGAGLGVPGAADADTIRNLLSRLVPDVVRKQVEIGVDVINDGEYGKSSWTGYINGRLGGFEARPAPESGGLMRGGYDMQQYSDYYNEARQRGTLWHTSVAVEAPPPTPLEYVCTAPIEYTGRAIMGRDIANFQAALKDVNAVEAFLPVAAPASIEVSRRNEYYKTQEEFLFALAEAMHDEYQMIVDAGFLVQIDDAMIPALWDRWLPDIGMERYLAYCDLRAEALNHALRGISPEMVRYHICWGSWHGPHVSDVPLKDILPLVLKINAAAYVIEAANVRHEHEYHIWDDVKLPEGKILIPGVVSHATNVVEHPDLVAERITRYASRVGRENVIAATDCGLGGRVHPQVAWAKLASLVEGAHQASKQLW